MAKKPRSNWGGFSLNPRLEMPEGVWMQCSSCKNTLYCKAVASNMHICTECGQHFRIDADTRIKQLADESSFEEFDSELISSDPLNFHFRGTSYKDRLRTDAEKSGSTEAVKIGRAFIKGRRVILGVMDSSFLMGSMGEVVGEKFCRAAERAVEEKVPLIMVVCSGGARMHEGVISVQQMAKTSAALSRLDDAGGLFIPILTDPTTGGVTASFAMLGDIIAAEPGALIGFAGPRVIKQTINVDLPEGFQRSEFLLEHGFVDMIIDRRDLRKELAKLIDYLWNK
ncbi:acetyl-CoA carboxylase, carboxyltransferase subunit beta [Sedimentisphaera salicampi]|uniref:Acetyl-coenzyme A carboxylase carboxyl transferase subunit beta n=1 Tax=Sedimentisphaera salicampi TaxID=1941349 RepID=A0A1W6LKT4_9BACT|nr:acetyl-CoA carboxylase, carboxyltransferase subunit beta [Sedimentisphaera salicampi]ARN56387.1 Acetyl-coenzyme A carboxylase carboxyl transferase subunit beta [Sedimentisphaera salicampi]OXU15273.1 Acetyl-coenzyme A carboxylase carboxyl transferase subunit beta [Sedimentisphaera salicampi]